MVVVVADGGGVGGVAAELDILGRLAACPPGGRTIRVADAGAARR